MYNEKVLDHFRNPRNQGSIENADGAGAVGNETCGDTMKIYIKVKNDTVDDVKFETLGCAAAISSSSVYTELVKGKTIEEALKITDDDVVRELGGLPEHKLHCSLLAERAFKEAVDDYTKRTKRNTKDTK